MLFKVVTKPLRVPDTLFQRGELFPRCIELVPVESRKDVQVIVPDILIPGRFVVLPGRDAVTMVNGFQREGHSFRHPVDSVRDPKGQFVDILVVIPGDDEHMAGIVGPPVSADEGKNQSICVDDFVETLCVLPVRDATERASPVRKLVAVFPVRHARHLCLKVAMLPSPGIARYYSSRARNR